MGRTDAYLSVRDVPRIISDDFTPGEFAGFQVTGEMVPGLAVLFALPIVMVFLSQTLVTCKPQGEHRPSN
jgi:hypothetical protein